MYNSMNVIVFALLKFIEMVKIKILVNVNQPACYKQFLLLSCTSKWIVSFANFAQILYQQFLF